MSDITITPKAADQINRIKTESEVIASSALRIGVKGGGCSGLMYTMNFDSDKREGDSVIESNGITLFVDGKSLFYLDGLVLDFSDGLNGKGFMFQNPNATKKCGCGESFSV
ncbi:MAG: iron-sulfur cluster assembly accessory protein [Ignavibacteria bacterium]|nr:iron-sulfur cluster assembly accessory protein [Ignavibacteria bacterium]